MIVGLGGHLVSESVVARHLASSPARFSSDRHAFGPCLRRAAKLGPASSIRSIFDEFARPFARAIGYTVSDVATDRAAVHATLSAAAAISSLTVVGWNEPLGPRWRDAILSARQRNVPWALLCNGTQVRLLAARRLYSRRFLEFALDLALDDELSATVLWELLNADTLLQSSSSAESPMDQLIAASDRHAADVGRRLKDGVLAASCDVLNAFVQQRPVPPLDQAFEQTLTTVYRLLFLLFAEARGLVPLWHPVYRESYSIEALCAAAASGEAQGLWDALRAVSRLAHHGCRAGTLRVTPFNGRLFAPSRTPLVERSGLDDEAARRAVLSVATQPAADGSGRQRISYAELGVEQLGAVYETLLDYRPQPTPAPDERPRRAASTRYELRAGNGERKSTGTFYTPQTIATELTRRTLEPLVRNRTPEQILALRVLDPAMGSGAFLVTACGFLAQAYEIALVDAGLCRSADIDAAQRVAIRRTIAERCLYGVDLNPMAVQLARLSLWLATLAADQPLSFLDHHLQTGNSLLGTWLTHLRQPPSSRRRATPVAPSLFDDATVTLAMKASMPGRFSLATANHTAAQVREKERTLAALTRADSPLARWKRIADLWCAPWFSSRVSPAAFRTLSDYILTGVSALPMQTANGQLTEVLKVAATHRFFHWELEFPEAFFDASGEPLPAAGFDAVLGNPPWDMLRADHGGNTATGGSERSVVRFTRDAGVYHAQSDGHANKYQLFVERGVSLLRPGGRIGLVLPSGLIADHGSAALRRRLFTDCAVDSIVGFDNRARLFPIHRSVRFLMLTATRGEATSQIDCRFGVTDPQVLAEPDLESSPSMPAPVRFTMATVTRLSGPELTIPDVRSEQDLVLAERAAALFAPLGSAAGWGAHFGRELNATDNRRDFVAPDRGWPVLEGKAIRPFTADIALAHWGIAPSRARALLGTRCERPRLAYRDVASATNQLTLIAAILPRNSVSTHTIFCLRTPLPLRAQYFLCGLFNSFVLNYFVRLRVTTHVTTAIVERLPVPSGDNQPAAFTDIAACARRLCRGSADRQAFARLNARVAALYQLTPGEFAHIVDTFPLVEPQQREAALAQFRMIA
jgi:hypothetical protein